MFLTAPEDSPLSIRFLLLPILLTATGCIPYPVNKQLQPKSTAVILDENNTPIERAQVSLIASSYPNGLETGWDLKFTNNQGLVTFDAKQEWRIEMFLLHSAESFFWNWCVYKPGYETYQTNYLSADEWQDIFTVNLTPGIARECIYQREDL